MGCVVAVDVTVDQRSGMTLQGNWTSFHGARSVDHRRRDRTVATANLSSVAGGPDDGDKVSGTVRGRVRSHGH